MQECGLALLMASAVNKLGGKIEAEDILCQWELHRAAESVSDRRKREADGFLRGIIVANNISREEAAEFFKVGRYRYDRLRNMDPTKPIPKKPPAYHKVTQEDKELVKRQRQRSY